MTRPTRLRRWRIFALGVLLLATTAVPAPARAADPLVHGTVLARWDGVDVHFNAKDATSETWTSLGYQWQCVELIQRYYAMKGWVKTTGKFAGVYPSWGGEHANQMLALAKANTKGQVVPRANHSKYAPVPGDVLVFSDATGWPDGHVALITSVDVKAGVIRFVQQNVKAPPPYDPLPFASDAVGLSTYQRWEADSHGKRTYTTQYVVESYLPCMTDSLCAPLLNPPVSYPDVLGWVHAVANKKPPKAAVETLWQP